MKDIYKNPIFYYILVPIITALWPLLIWTVYLPDVEDSWQAEKKQYAKGQKIMTEILNLDPDRLDFADSKNAGADFDYANVVETVASSCRIPPTNYKLSSGVITTSGGQKSQNARVGLKQVDITKFAKFLSTIQFRWASLRCTNIKLTKRKGLPDIWDIDLDFKYYF